MYNKATILSLKILLHLNKKISYSDMIIIILIII